MDDGGRALERELSAGGGVPVVVAGALAGGGAGLFVLAVFAYLKASPLRLVRVLGWLLRGLKAAESKLVQGGAVADLPLSPLLADIAARAAAQGRPVYLASRRCSPLLEAVAARHPGLAGVIVVPGGLSGRRGADEALAHLPQGYDAVVRVRGTTHIARHAPTGVPTAGADASDLLPAGAEGSPPRVSLLRELIASLRLHQCVKNTLVFVPLILSGRFTRLVEIGDTLLAFAALTSVVCGTYILNDIWDVADDRAHWSKRERPIASGRLSAAVGLALALALIAAGLLLAAYVSQATLAVLGIYLALTLAYSLYVKTVPFLDGFALASLFTLRLGLGAVAADAPPSPWLFVFSMFLFSSLGYAKRYTEISRAVMRNSVGRYGRGYHPVDAPMVLAVGMAAGIAAVVIMVLYIVEEEFRNSFAGNPAWLWGFPPLVFLFVVRIWLVSVRGEMMDDPVAFAVRDKTSIALLALLLICFTGAWLG